MPVTQRLVQLVLRLHQRASGGPDGRERGDVPGWVLITLMTAALVTAIWVFAEDQLLAMLESALDSVRPD